MLQTEIANPHKMEPQSGSSRLGFAGSTGSVPAEVPAVHHPRCQWCPRVQPGLCHLRATGQQQQCQGPGTKAFGVGRCQWWGWALGSKFFQEDLTIFLVFSTPSRRTAGGHTSLRDWSGKSLDFTSNL